MRCALEEYVIRRRKQRIIELFGTVQFEDDYDFRAERLKERA